MRNALIAGLILATVALSALAIMPAHAQTSISVSDPEGDDRGPGTYGYPTNEVFQPGVFDLLGFTVTDTGNALEFRVKLKNLGDNPWGGPNGFCLQYVQIYVHTTASGPARVDTFGLNFLLRPDYAWNFAILLAPGWEESPVPTGQRAAIYFANGTVVVQDGAFNVSVDETNNEIVATVAKSVLPDADNFVNWKYVVAVASYDGYGPMRVRAAGVTGGEWAINATEYATSQDQVTKLAQAIAKGMEPRALDLLVYSNEYNGITADQQYEWLWNFDPETGALPIVPGIERVTETVTETETVTTTATATATVYQTTTATTTVTTTSTSVSVSTATTTVPQTDWTMTGVVGIVLLLIGLGIGYAVFKK